MKYKYIIRDERGQAVAKIEKSYYDKLIEQISIRYETIDTNRGELNIARIKKDSYVSYAGIFIYLWEGFYIHRLDS